MDTKEKIIIAMDMLDYEVMRDRLTDFDPQHLRVTFRHKTTYKHLFVVTGNYGLKDKIEAFGLIAMPHQEAGSGILSDTRIKFSTSKTPAKMANDIKNRLLPGYETQQKIAIETKKETENYTTEKRNRLLEISALLEQPFVFERKNYEEGDFFIKDCGYLSVSSHNTKEVVLGRTLGVPCTPKQALQIIDILRSKHSNQDHKKGD